MLRRWPATSVSSTSSRWSSSLDRSTSARSSCTVRSASPSPAAAPARAASAFRRGAFQALEVRGPLGAALEPLTPLGGEHGALLVELGDLAEQGARRLFGRGDGLGRAVEPLGGGAEAGADVRFLNLPVDPVLPRGLLFRLDRGERGPLAGQRLVFPTAGCFTSGEGVVHLVLPLVGVAQALSDPSEPGSASGQLAGQVLDHPGSVLARGGRRALLLTGLFQPRHRLRRGAVRLRQANLGGGERRGDFTRGAILLLDFGAELPDLGAAPERPAGAGRRGQDHRAAGAAQGMAPLVHHFRAAQQRLHPAARGPFGAELRLERARSVGRAAGPAVGGEEHQRAGLDLGVPLPDGLDRVLIPHQHGVHPFAEEALGQLGGIPIGADVVAQRAEHRAVEPAPGGEQRGGGRRQAHPLALQLLERGAPGGELGQALLHQPLPIALAGFLLPGLRHVVPAPLGLGGGGQRGLGAPVRGVGAGSGAGLGGGQIGPQLAGVGLGVRGALPKRGDFLLQRRPLSFERAKLLDPGRERLLRLAHPAALRGEPVANFLLRGGAVGQVQLDALVLLLGGTELRRGGFPFPLRLLGAPRGVGPLLLVTAAALLGIAQPLAGHRDVTVEAGQRDLHLGELAGDLGAMLFGAQPGARRLVLARGGLAQAGAERRQPLGERAVALFHPGGPLGKVVEMAPREGERHRELLFHQLGVPLRLALLPGQGADLRLHLGDQVFQPLQVGGGLLEPALGAVLAVAVEADARGLLEQRAALLGAIGQEQVDHLGFDDHAGVAAQAGAAEQILDVAEPDRQVVEEVFALARPREPPGDSPLPDRRSAARRRCCRGGARLR